jgi:DNA repair protein RecO (recombination protein O)
MDWVDNGIMLTAVAHGETGAVVSVLTEQHGRHPGMVRGRTRLRGVLEPGVPVVASWRGRLPHHLGYYQLEPRGGALLAAVLDDPARLLALAAVCQSVHDAVPERAPFPRLYHGLCGLLAALEAQDDPLIWGAVLVRWELGLLAELGFGLDLNQCAATGRNDQLAYVSPRSGRAVSLSAGEPYHHRLLTLPPFLSGAGTITGADVLAGLVLTGFFLDRMVFAAVNCPLPVARVQLIDRLTHRFGLSDVGSSTTNAS